MKFRSRTSREFRKRFAHLPAAVQEQARRSYRLWRQNPWHTSLDFKQVHPSRAFYSVRIGSNWRAVGSRRQNEIVWFWIGPHSAYDTLLKKL